MHSIAMDQLPLVPPEKAPLSQVTRTIPSHGMVPAPPDIHKARSSTGQAKPSPGHHQFPCDKAQLSQQHTRDPVHGKVPAGIEGTKC